MFYYLYQITNLINHKIYIGVHKTSNLNDGYMGSGKVIKSAIEKYGLSNFRKDILEFFENAECMYAREKEVVDDVFLLREDVYNIRRGGNGGFDYINSNGLNDRTGSKLSDSQKRNISIARKSAVTEKHRKEISERMRGNSAAKGNKSGVHNRGKQRSEDTKEKIKNTIKQLWNSGHFENRKRCSNPKPKNKGKIWINNGEVCKMILSSDIIPDGWVRGRI